MFDTHNFANASRKNDAQKNEKPSMKIKKQSRVERAGEGEAGKNSAERAKFGTIGEPEAIPGDGNNHGRCSRLAIGSLVTGPESLINRDYGGDGACEGAPRWTTPPPPPSTAQDRWSSLRKLATSANSCSAVKSLRPGI